MDFTRLFCDIDDKYCGEVLSFNKSYMPSLLKKEFNNDAMHKL